MTINEILTARNGARTRKGAVFGNMNVGCLKRAFYFYLNSISYATKKIATPNGDRWAIVMERQFGLSVSPST
jgi:hypothetical protein